MSVHASPIFTGTATALVTPFQDGKIDFPTLGKLMDRQIEAGISALVLCGTTGEAATMSIAEHVSCVSFAAEHARGRATIIAGCGCNCTAKALTLTKECCRAGADALLSVTPYYNKASPEGLIRHFSLIADTAEKPVLLYNVPSRTGCHIPIAVYEVLARHGNIVGTKEASGNLSAIAEVAARCGPDFAIYSGNDDQYLPILSIGGVGCVSVVANIMPKETEQIGLLYKSGLFAQAQTAQLSLLPLIAALFCEVNPLPVKYALYRMGLCREEMRLPLCPPAPESQRRIEAVLRQYALLPKGGD